MKKLLIALVVLVGIAAATTHRAEIYRDATSPDGSWSVEVLRKRNRLYPLLEGVFVIVRIKNQQKQTIFEHVIDCRDIWKEVDDRYHEVICANDSISVGPQYWDGNVMTNFHINKALEANFRK